MSHPSDFGLLTVEQVDGLSTNDPNGTALKATVRWVREFVAKSHPELKKGDPDWSWPVCPFMPRSLDRNLAWFTVPSGEISAPADVERAVGRFKDVIKMLDPTDGIDAYHKTVVVVFPTVPLRRASTYIDDVQAEIRGHYRADGLMIGEFHKDNTSGGRYNDDFRPLRSPYPMIAIRLMVRKDRYFLLDAPSISKEELISNREAYLRWVPVKPSVSNGEELKQILIKRNEDLK